VRTRAILVAAALMTGACATPSPEIERIRAENELLKAEIEVIKRNCSYYREVEVEVEAEEERSP
jgi:hypothetical protein